MKRLLAALLLVATGFWVWAFAIVPPDGLDGLFGPSDGDLAQTDSIAIVHAAMALLALLPFPVLRLLPLAWAGLGAILWAFVAVMTLLSAPMMLSATGIATLMLGAYLVATWALVVTLGPVGSDATGVLRRNLITGLLLGAAAAAPLALVAVVAAPGLAPPSGLSRHQYAFCTNDSGRVFGGHDLVFDLAAEKLDVWLAPQQSVLGSYRDGQWAAACRFAHTVYGLSTDESIWCHDGGNRAAFLEPAVEILGSEGGHYPAPGDSAWEYVQACRLAYNYLRQSDPRSITETHPFFALSSAERSYCETAGEDVIGQFLSEFRLHAPRDANVLEMLHSRAVGCRLAFSAQQLQRLAAALP